MTERWIKLKKPFSRYSASSAGRFKTPLGKIAKLETKRSANPAVRMYNSETGRYQAVSARHLIAELFLPKPEEGFLLRNIDGDRYNLAADNLEYFNPMCEDELKTNPTRDQIIELAKISLNLKNMALQLNVSITVLRRLVQQYELREILANKVMIEGKPVDIEKVQWVTTKSMKEHYQFSNTGLVRNKKTKHVVSSPDTVSVKTYPLYINGNVVYVDLAKLIARAFIPNPNKYKYLKFLDGDVNNCRADNMVWIPNRVIDNLRATLDYRAESSELVKDYLNHIETMSNRDIMKRNGSTMSRLNSELRQYGFPVCRKKIIEELKHHREQGTFEDYIKGLTNIKRVELLEGEIRKPIPECPGYFITNFGRVISHKIFYKEELLNTYVARGFLSCVLSVNGSRKCLTVKRLVADMFIDNPYGYTRSICIDGNPSNCRADNIKLMSNEQFNALVRERKYKSNN